MFFVIVTGHSIIGLNYISVPLVTPIPEASINELEILLGVLVIVYIAKLDLLFENADQKPGGSMGDT